MRVFKYVDAPRADILRSETIAFTPPDRFKDPFELRPRVIPITDKSHLKRRFKNDMGAVRLEFPSIFKGFTRKQRRAMESREIQKAVKAIRSDAGRYAEQVQDSFVSMASEHFGILCLSAVQDHDPNWSENLMWYHYADGHRGFVIEFDPGHEDFRQLGKLRKVDYLEKPGVLNLSKPSAEFWCVKPKYLGYEREYRIRRELPASTPHKTDDGKPLYLRPLPRACVKAVYLGHRIDPDLRKQILELLKGGSALRFDTVPSRRDFTLSFREITDER